jgi:carbonic anhydrase
METRRLCRRRLLQAAGALSLAVAGPLAPADERKVSARETPPRNAAEALTLLKEGNRRFSDGKLRHAHEAADWRKHLVREQKPFATLLGCSDSRVSPELVFDQGLGDLFVIRVAGNVIDTDILGSIQYAVRHLRTHLLVVLGHEGCGAVTATLDVMDGKAKEPKYIEALASKIQPGLKSLARLEGDERLRAAVEANVRWSMRRFASLPEARKALKEKTITLVGAVYELKSGKVRFLS